MCVRTHTATRANGVPGIPAFAREWRPAAHPFSGEEKQGRASHLLAARAGSAFGVGDRLKRCSKLRFGGRPPAHWRSASVRDR